MRRPLQRSDGGATLVEYALIVALVVVASFGAIQFLTNQSEAEVATQADCVSTRPPPPSCQPRAVTTAPPASSPSTPTSTIPADTTTTTESTTTTTTTTTTAPPPATTPPPATAPPSYELSLTTTTGRAGASQNWSAEVSPIVTNASNGIVAGVEVRFSWAAGSNTGQGICVTGPDGRCGPSRIPASGNLNGSSVTSVQLSGFTVAGRPVQMAADPVIIRRPW
jgi:Flp pilus assembly pilin Flp